MTALQIALVVVEGVVMFATVCVAGLALVSQFDADQQVLAERRGATIDQAA